MTQFNRPRPVAWFFFLAAFGTCMALGTWQVQRLEWKQGLIAEIAAANESAPLTALPQTAEELEKLQFHKVTLSGTWVADTEFHITPRYYRDQFGYHLVTPLKLAAGHSVLVNRGWIPAKKKEADTRPETRLKGKATITGLVRTGAERSYFTPPSQPEKNLWFGRDIEQMATHASLKNTIPAMLDLIGEQKAEQLPIPSDGTIRLRNDHVSYILTWYGIGLGILVIFLVYHRKKAV
jgi:surfeit locus 1 family protein